jgi:Spy/CpxP family protein refolding chaperone
MRNFMAVLAVLGLMAWLGGSGAALADDVSVKVITPDKAPPPKATDPATPDPAKAAGAAKPADALQSGDRRIDGLLGGLDLTADQVAKIQPLVEPILKDLKAGRDAVQKKQDELSKQIEQGGDAAKPARDELDKLTNDSRAKRDELRKQLLEKVDPVLTDSQKTKLKELSASGQPTGPGGGPGRGNPLGGRGGFGGGASGVVSGMLDRAGIKLTDDQQKKVDEKLAALVKDAGAKFQELRDKMQALREKTRQAGGDADAQKELDALGPKMMQQFADSIKTASDAVRELLDPEQQKKFDDSLAKVGQDRNRMTVDGMVRRADRAGLTDDQKKKVADLAKAAGEAMDKLKSDDRDGRDQLQQQLTKDVEALLTDEQKTKFNDPRGGGFGRFGGRGGRGGRGGQPSNPPPAPATP